MRNNSSRFQIYQKVRVIYPTSKYYQMVGIVWNIRSYCIDVMFAPWTAPKTRRGRSLVVSFDESEIKPR